MKLKAIQTRYNGYTFRSRLEARYAVLFEYLQLRYKYEFEGYDLSGNYYLPDFYLPELDCFVEVKGEKPTDQECNLAYLLSKDSEKFVHIVSGSIPLPDMSLWYKDGFMVYTFKYSLKPGISANTKLHSQYLNDIYTLNQCPDCKKINFCKNGMISYLPCGCSRVKSNTISPFIVRAWYRARSTRFDNYKSRK